MFQVETRLNCPWRGWDSILPLKQVIINHPPPPPNPQDKLLVNPLTQLVTNYIMCIFKIINNNNLIYKALL